MSDFAKIVVIDGQQVLFFVEEDDDHEDCLKLNQIVDFEGVRANISLGGIPNSTVEKVLAHATEDQARYVIDTDIVLDSCWNLPQGSPDIASATIP